MGYDNIPLQRAPKNVHQNIGASESQETLVPVSRVSNETMELWRRFPKHIPESYHVKIGNEYTRLHEPHETALYLPYNYTVLWQEQGARYVVVHRH